MAKISVLRLGHRLMRDKRISTHCGLVARAFGATEIFYSGEYDSKMEKGISDIVKRWGGNFKIRYTTSPKKIIRNWNGSVVHLTMYGLPVQEKIDEIRRNGDILLVVGGSKVPSEIYKLADYNIAISNQPHSEIAALAVFLHEYFQGKELGIDFDGELKIIPDPQGKRVIDRSK